MKPSPERGAVLLLVAVLVLFVGILMTFGLDGFQTQDVQDRIYRTKFREDFLIRELSAYVQRTNSLPCPADPAIARATAAFGTQRAVCNTVPLSEGIVPYRTLGLSEFDAVDGWGRFMTYRISPVLAINKAVIPAMGVPGRVIYDRCRRFPWFDHTAAAAPHNTFPEKATFCCPPIDIAGLDGTSDLRVLNNAGGALAAANIGRPAGPGAPDYADLDTSTAFSTLPAIPNNQDLFAVAIISHGSNGIGAFVEGGGRLGVPSAAAGADEQENFDNDIDIVSHAENLATGPNYFDDIVIWRTQTTLMGELNNTSCYLPWR